MPITGKTMFCLSRNFTLECQTVAQRSDYYGAKLPTMRSLIYVLLP